LLNEFVLTPKVAKTIRAASVFRQVIVLIFNPASVTEIVRGKIHSGGYVETIEKKRRHIPIARPAFRSPDASIEEIDELDKLEKEALKVGTFEGCRVPVLIAYNGVAAIVNPQMLLALQTAKADESGKKKITVEVAGKQQEIEVDNATMRTLSIVTGDDGKQSWKDVFIRVLLPIDPSAIKKWLDKLYDQVIFDSAFQDAYDEGKQANKMMTDMKPAYIILGCIVIAGIAAMVILHFS
jgi:hypothetical protein